MNKKRPSVKKNTTTKIGRQARNNRKKQEQKRIVQAAINIIHKNMSFLNSNNRSIDIYQNEVRFVQSRLQESFPTKAQFRVAMEVFANRVEEKNEFLNCDFEVPNVPITIKRYKPTHSLDFFKNSSRVGELAYRFEELLKKENIINPLSKKEKLLLIPLSSILFGPHGSVTSVAALANYFLKHEKVNHSKLGNTDLVWIDLELKNDKQNNVRLDDKELSIERFFIDSVTLGFINQFLKDQNPIKVTKSFDSKNLFSSIKKLLENLGVWVKGIISLKQLCLGGTSEMTNQEGVDIPWSLAEISMKNYPSSSLPDIFFSQILSPQINNLGRIQFKDYEGFPTNFSRTKKRSSTSKPKFVRRLTKAINQNDKNGKLMPAQFISHELGKFLDPNLPLALVCLVKFFQHHLNDVGNVVSTVKRYSSAISNLICYISHSHPFEEMVGEEITAIYKTHLEGRTKKQRSFEGGVLQQFHEFGVKNFGFPGLTSNLITGSKLKPFVNAGYISNTLYQNLLIELENISDLDSHTKLSLKLAVVIAYRTGTRISEVLSIKLKDIERSKDLFCIIRSNEYSDLKSVSARRRIKLSTVLSPDELNALRSLLAVRKRTQQNKNELLFCHHGDGLRAFNFSSVSRLVSDILRKLSGNQLVVFHHLRHTAISNLFLIVCKEWELAEQLTGLPRKQLIKIRQNIIGDSSNPICDFWALSSVAGHASPHTTIQSYVHFYDLIVYLKLSRTSRMLTRNQAANTFGVNTYFAKQIRKTNSLPLDKLPLEALRKYSVKKLKPFVQSLKTTKHRHGDQPLEVGLLNQKQQITHSDVYVILKDIDLGHRIDDIAYRFHVPNERIKFWQWNATRLKQIKTRQGTPRLFSKERLTNNPNAISPTQPLFRNERTQVTKVIREMRQHYKNDKDLLHEVIRYFILHSTSTRTGVSFSNKKTFKWFIKALKSFIPYHHWTLIIVPHTFQDMQSAKRDWAAPQNIKVKLDRTIKNRTSSKQAYLHLKHPDEGGLISSSSKYTKFTSTSLRYIFHMIAIMRFGEEDFKKVKESSDIPN